MLKDVGRERIMKFHENEGIDRLIKGAGLLIVLYFIKKQLDEAKRKGTESLTSENLAVRLSQILKQGVNPSGYDWMIDMDGTDEDLIKSVAPQITDLNEVAKRYEEQYKESLYVRLQKELDAADYQKFLNLIQKKDGGKNNNNPPVRTDIPPQNWVVTKYDTNARKTPVKESKYIPANNILKTFKPETWIGLSTGKYAYDSKNDVLFIEVVNYNKKQEKVYFYVAKSQIIFKTIEERKKLKESGKDINYQTLDGVQDLEGVPANQQTQLVTLKQAEIYNEQFEKKGKAAKNLILGFPIMHLNTSTGDWVQFETVQGQKRWVKAAEVKSINRA